MHKAKYPQASEKFAFVAELYGLYPALISSQTLRWPLTYDVLQKHRDTASSSLSPRIFGLYVITAGHFRYSSGGRYTLEAEVYSDFLATEGV